MVATVKIQHSNVVGNLNYTATGGTITDSGNFKIHTFTGPGTFTVISNVQETGAGQNTVDYLVVAGGGGGAGNWRWWRRSAGGYREVKF